MGTEPGVGGSESANFAQALSTLKRQGSNILLVGETGPSAHEPACGRLLGDGSGENRYRIFVSTDPSARELSPATDASIAGENTASHYLFHTDSEDDVPHDLTEDEVTVTPMLGVLGTEFVELVNEFEADTGSLNPSQLRVCVDSVADLLADHQSENVFRLLHVMTTRTIRASGMGHFHLPVESDSEAVQLFKPLFDAVVELRCGADGPEHRWTLRDKSTVTDWIPLTLGSHAEDA